jgi:hypothetical protein
LEPRQRSLCLNPNLDFEYSKRTMLHVARHLCDDPVQPSVSHLPWRFWIGTTCDSQSIALAAVPIPVPPKSQHQGQADDEDLDMQEIQDCTQWIGDFGDMIFSSFPCGIHILAVVEYEDLANASPRVNQINYVVTDKLAMMNRIFDSSRMNGFLVSLSQSGNLNVTTLPSGAKKLQKSAASKSLQIIEEDQAAASIHHIHSAVTVNLQVQEDLKEEKSLDAIEKASRHQLNALLDGVGAVMLDGSLVVADDIQDASNASNLLDFLSEQKDSISHIHQLELFIPVETSKSIEKGCAIEGTLCVYAIVPDKITLKELVQVCRHFQLTLTYSCAADETRIC